MNITPRWQRPPWRRTIFAIVYAFAGPALTILAIWLIWNVLHAPWPISLAEQRLTIIGVTLYITQGLLGLVLTGIGMTVALRSVSAKFAGLEAGITGGNHEDGPEQENDK
jgi:uncharacterized membrane protein